MTHKFVSRRVSEDELSVSYEFLFLEGEPNDGLLKTVFGEFIEEPILKKSRSGQSFIELGQCPLLDRMMSYTVEEVNEHKILFSISSQHLKSKIVDEVEENTDDMFMKFADGTIIRLRNATDRAMAQIMYMLVLVDVLDGMTIDVNIEDYYPNCKNCCLCKDNFQKYIKLAEEEMQNFVETRSNCITGNDAFDLEKDVVECDGFIRKTYPDITELLATISVLPEIENL